MRYQVSPPGRGSARRIVSTAEMRAVDAEAIEVHGVPSLALMENAARQVALVAAAHAAPGAPIGVVCGGGNNGGDGLAAARHLAAWGFAVEVVLCAEPERLRSDAAVHLACWQAGGGEIRRADDLSLFQTLPAPGHYALLVDALLGTGLSGPVRGVAREAIAWVAGHRAPIVSVDIPSGLCGDTGAVLGVAVEAAATVTFGASKLGHWVAEGPRHTGALHITDIGLPAGCIERLSAPRRLLDGAALSAAFASRPLQAHKGWAGHLYVLAGALGKTGAARMAADAALAGGVGLVTIGTTAEALLGLGPVLYEAMAEAALTGRPADDAARLVDEVNARDAAVIGPGLPAEPWVGEALAAALPRISQPVVLDAEALNRLSAQPALLGLGGPRVITPHPGEAARLLGSSAAAVQADRVGAAHHLVAATGAVVVLKGAHTLIAAPDGRLGLCPDGNPGMASAGMGDALAGVLGALLARGVPAYEAACAAVVWHARAGDRAAATHGHNGLRASTLIDALRAVELHPC